ncbi:MAG: hypothetical protein ABEJ31_05250 [Haloarculaceae archaeon]
MYDNRRLASGVGVLLTLWALVGLLVLSSGVGVSIPITATGGFNMTADYMSASEATAVPSKVPQRLVPAVTFEIKKSYVQGLQIEKTLDVGSLPGLNGNLRLLIRSDTAKIDGVSFQTNHITAKKAIWRGFILDERRNDSVYDQFLAYAGPNPNDHLNTNDPLQIAGSTPGATRPGERAAFQLYNARIHSSHLAADQVDLSNMLLVVQYDPDDDGVYEYGT